MKKINQLQKLAELKLESFFETIYTIDQFKSPGKRINKYLCKPKEKGETVIVYCEISEHKESAILYTTNFMANI